MNNPGRNSDGSDAESRAYCYSEKGARGYEERLLVERKGAGRDIPEIGDADVSRGVFIQCWVSSYRRPQRGLRSQYCGRACDNRHENASQTISDTIRSTDSVSISCVFCAVQFLADRQFDADFCAWIRLTTISMTTQNQVGLLYKHATSTP